jgi:hypothetical protein
MSNEILIRNQVITIPKMNISSSAMNIDIEGTHNFDNEIDYGLKILLTELKKQDNKERVEDEYGAIVEDEKRKATWHFRITGTVDNPQFVPVDVKSVYSSIKEDMKKEKESIKTILKEEFGGKKTKKDTTENIIEHKEGESPKLIIKWDDE